MPYPRFGPAEAWRRRRLGNTIHLDECSTRSIVRMAWRFAKRKHRRVTNIAPEHDRIPFVARPRPDDCRDLVLQRGPRFAIHLRLKRCACDAGLVQQLAIELRLDRADRDML